LQKEIEFNMLYVRQEDTSETHFVASLINEPALTKDPSDTFIKILPVQALQ
jgi:hypothetical protein